MQTYLPYLQSPYAIATLFLLVIVLLIVNIFLIIRLNKVFRGSRAESLYPLLTECVEKIERLENHDKLLAEHAEVLDSKVSQAVRNVSIMRFKAFESGNSNQSFSIALVNEKGDGVVVSSLHHRDRVSTYAKEVKGYESEHDLSEEESAVLEASENAHKI